MRTAIILELDPYNQIYKIDDKQSLISEDNDIASFGMSLEERVATNYDIDSGKFKEKKKTITKLLISLRCSWYDTTKKRYLKDELLSLWQGRNSSVRGKEVEIWGG